MIGKIVGYSAFKSYAQVQYPTLKQGKDLQLKNQVWSSTKRQQDHVSALDNFQNFKSNYHKNHLQNTNPKDYHPDYVQKGGSSTLNFKGTGLSEAYDKKESQFAGTHTNKESKLLNTGTEHWKTSYRGNIAEPIQKAKATGFNATQNSVWSASKRSQSTGKPMTVEQQSRLNSYKCKPYINNAKTGVSDYKFNYGEQIGSNPLQVMNSTSTKQPLKDHPLKHGTNQMWTEIPGYQGFKPSQLPFDIVNSKINHRLAQNKGNKKLNVIDNYPIKVPGYAGFKPRYQEPKQLRTSCFDFQK